MDNIPTLGAYHSETSAGYQLSGYSGPPSPPVLGEERPVPLGSQNADEYIDFALANGLLDEAQAAAMRASQPDAENMDDRVERAD